MTHVIYKTTVNLAFDGEARVSLPEGSAPLSLQVQRGAPIIWWNCPWGKPLNTFRLKVVATGQPYCVDDVKAYIGTWQDEEGLVWHFFVLK